jgi:hypothetical protein
MPPVIDAGLADAAAMESAQPLSARVPPAKKARTMSGT